MRNLKNNNSWKVWLVTFDSFIFRSSFCSKSSQQFWMNYNPSFYLLIVGLKRVTFRTISKHQQKVRNNEKNIKFSQHFHWQQINKLTNAAWQSLSCSKQFCLFRRDDFRPKAIFQLCSEHHRRSVKVERERMNWEREERGEEVVRHF